jgi:hypothetical protein
MKASISVLPSEDGKQVEISFTPYDLKNNTDLEKPGRSAQGGMWAGMYMLWRPEHCQHPAL